MAAPKAHAVPTVCYFLRIKSKEVAAGCGLTILWTLLGLAASAAILAVVETVLKLAFKGTVSLVF